MKKIRYLARLFLIYFSFLLKKQKVNYKPVRLWIEASSRCNLKCRLCVNRDLPENAKGDMNFTLYRKIIDESKGYIFDINLFHRGEPLLNPEIVEMIGYATRNNIKTRLHTNATLLNSELSEKLIKAKLNLISFSFDGYTDATYEKNRIGASYKKSLENITGFLQIKKRLGSNLPFAQLQIMEYDEELSREQFTELKKDFLKKFEGLPLDKFIIRTPHNWGGSLKINGKKARVESFYCNSFTACTFPWYALTIFYDGEVFACPQDFYGNIRLGDVKTDFIKDIFNNKAMQELRQSFRKKETMRHQPCSSCDRCRRKTVFGIPGEYLGTFLKDSLKKN